MSYEKDLQGMHCCIESIPGCTCGRGKETASFFALDLHENEKCAKLWSRKIVRIFAP